MFCWVEVRNDRVGVSVSGVFIEHDKGKSLLSNYHDLKQNNHAISLHCHEAPSSWKDDQFQVCNLGEKSIFDWTFITSEHLIISTYYLNAFRRWIQFWTWLCSIATLLFWCSMARRPLLCWAEQHLTAELAFFKVYTVFHDCRFGSFVGRNEEGQTERKVYQTSQGNHHAIQSGTNGTVRERSLSGPDWLLCQLGIRNDW